MGRKGGKGRRAAAKRARRMEEEDEAAAEAARTERENAEVVRTFNNPDWEEFAACTDMPGRILKKKAPLDPELTV